MFCFGSRGFGAFRLRACWPENAAIYCTAATLAFEMAFRVGFGASWPENADFWRSEWLLGPPGARNGCSGLPRCRHSVRNGRLSLHRCHQSARNGRSGMPLCRQSARNGRSGTVLCHTGSKIELEVAFEIAVRRICARCHETLLHYALLCMACAWICTGSH